MRLLRLAYDGYAMNSPAFLGALRTTFAVTVSLEVAESSALTNSLLRPPVNPTVTPR